MATRPQTESSDSTDEVEQYGPARVRARRWPVIVTLCVVLVLLVVGVVYARPLYFYARLMGDSDMRHRCIHVHQLARSGLVGRVLARSYIRRQFCKKPSCGTSLALQERQLWMDMKRAKLARCFGPPDETDGAKDVWYTYRKQLLRELRTARRPPSWEDTWYQWYICMQAEYDGDNRLAKLALSAWPGDIIVHYDLGSVPFEWSTSVPETASVPPEPEEWVEEKKQNDSAPPPQ
jgi:hypothetical protein